MKCSGWESVVEIVCVDERKIKIKCQSLGTTRDAFHIDHDLISTTVCERLLLAHFTEQKLRIRRINCPRP